MYGRSDVAVLVCLMRRGCLCRLVSLSQLQRQVHSLPQGHAAPALSMLSNIEAEVSAGVSGSGSETSLYCWSEVRHGYDRSLKAPNAGALMTCGHRCAPDCRWYR